MVSCSTKAGSWQRQEYWPSFVLFLGLLLTTLYVAYNRFLHHLARFPSPPFASLTNLWKVYHVYIGDFEHALLEAHRRYGKIVRVGPNHLDVSDASAVKVIYGSGRTFSKSSYYDAFTALRPNLFGARNEEIHSARRKACANGFSLQSVAMMEPFMDDCMRLLIHRLDIAASTGEEIDLKEWISFFVMDVLGELAFSGSFGALESGNPETMPPIRDHVLLAASSGNIPWLIPYINKVLPYIPIPSLQRMIRGRQCLRQLAVTSVERRIQSQSQRKDLLGRLLEELDQGIDSKGNKLDIKDIQTEAFGFIVAGSHTTAATSCLLLWHLFHNPHVLKKLQNEIRAIPLPDDSPVFSYSALANLTYFQVCVTENFRISPVFVMPLMRVVPKGGKEIANEFIPEGTDVSICNFALHHDPDVFGPDLERFVPERWLQGTYNKSQYLMPFGAGHRACIGRNIAITEIYKLVGSLISRFDFEYLPDARMQNNETMPKISSFGVADLDGMMLVRVHKRSF